MNIATITITAYCNKQNAGRRKTTMAMTKQTTHEQVTFVFIVVCAFAALAAFSDYFISVFVVAASCASTKKC